MPLTPLSSETTSQGSSHEKELFINEEYNMSIFTLDDNDDEDQPMSSERQRRAAKKLRFKKTQSQKLRSSSLSFVEKFVKVNFAKVKMDYRWEQLQEIERRRRKILTHVEYPIWRILLFYDGTVVRILAYDASFWLTIIIYIGMLVLSYWELPAYLSDLPSDSITVLGGFVSFFMVFWVNQSHSRFFGLYDASMACKGAIFNNAQLALNYLPPENATRLIRYMNGAHAAGYVGLSEVYPSGNYFNYANKTMGLLTEEERARLDDIDLDKGGSCSREMISWCTHEIAVAQRAGNIDMILADRLRQNVLQLQVNIGALYNAKDLPIPFFYVHFICLLTSLYLPLFALTSAIQAGAGDEIHWTNYIIRGLVVMLQAIFVIGLRVLGQKMSDPYGDDLIDLSVMYYIHFTWQMSNRILNSHLPEEADPKVENVLMKEREDLGPAWKDTKLNTSTSNVNKNSPQQHNPLRRSFYYDAMETANGRPGPACTHADIENQVFSASIPSAQSRIIYNPKPRRCVVTS